MCLKNDIWTQLFKWKSTIGAPRTPTISGTFSIIGRKPSFGTNRYTVKDATRFAEGYYYHSVYTIQQAAISLMEDSDKL